MSESAEQLRKMQMLQMADLGTARREMISTDEVRNQARAHIANIESKRRLDQRDEAQLSKWANLHAEIGDTQGMEELDDIECGQSHRANLHAMLHPNGSQPQTYANHPYPTPSAGRGGGVMGKRGRGGFAPPPRGPANLPPIPPRPSFHGNVTLPGRPGPRGRSATMSASIHLDPALNCNNDDSDARDRGRGRGRGKGRGRGNAQEQVHIPPAAIRPQRAAPAINFATRISEPGDFMSLFQSRRATETYKKSTDTIVSAPMQMTTSSPEPIPLNEPKVRMPPSGTIKKKKASILSAAKPTSSPSRVVPLEKTASFKTRKAQPDTSKPSRPPNKLPPVEAPTSPPAHSVSVSVKQGGKPKKAKPMVSGSQPLPAVVATAAEEIQWKILPGEQPRKKITVPPSQTAAFENSMPLAEVKKTPVAKGTKLKDSKQNVLPVSQREETKQKPQSHDLLDDSPVMTTSHHFKTVVIKTPVAKVTQLKDIKQNVPHVGQKEETKQKPQYHDLLSDDDAPANSAMTTPHHLNTVAINSPGAAELAGLQFAEKVGESVPAKSIDEVIVPKPTSNDPSREPEGFSLYGPQIIEELRDIRRHIHSPQDLATTRDIERILESKLLQLIPTASPPPAAPASSEIEGRLGNLLALVEYLTASQQGTNAVEVSSTARRDITPFEGHRSPPPPSSSSNSPPSAEKRAHKVHVPGLSPTRSESSDVISQFETLQVSDKLAAPLQPQRVVRASALRPLEIPKRATTSAIATLGSRAKESTKKPQTLNDSIFAGSVPLVTPNANVVEPNRPQTTTRVLSANHPNIPKYQDFQVIGARTIGPAPYKPRVIGPAPSPYEATTLRDVSTAHIRTVSVQHANTENRPSLDVTNRASTSMGHYNSSAAQQAPGQLFSMPDPATILQPKAKAAGLFAFNQSRR